MAYIYQKKTSVSSINTNINFSANRITAGYHKKNVIHDLSLPSLSGGTITALIGPNGAGKSTLMRALAGLLPMRGELTLNGIDLHRIKLRERAKLISFMPQNAATDISLSVVESVIAALKASPLDQLSSDNIQVRQLAFDTLDKIGIRELALENLSQLSGGQRQLASLARSVVRNPKVLLLDEPTSALDLHHQTLVMKHIRSLADEGRIVIVVLHDLNLAMRWADQVVLMQKGIAVAAGTPFEAITPIHIGRVYEVASRIEFCSRGMPHVIVDDIAKLQ